MKSSLKLAVGILGFILIFSIPQQIIAADSKPAESVPEAASSIAKDMNQTLELKRPLRIGVTTFSGTGKSGADNRFGEHLSETLTSALQKESRLFRLFERSRLDLVLKENALSLSGLINEQQAQKVGELVPLDAIFSGTYTPLKDTIELNARLVDVVTGEILFAYHGQIAMTDNLRTLFGFRDPGDKKKPTRPVPPEVACKKDWDRIKSFLTDLSSPEATDRVVNTAMKIPFHSPCGSIHRQVAHRLYRYKVIDPKYSEFLLQALPTLSASDRRVPIMIDYLAADGVIDDREWKAGLAIVQQLSPHRLDDYLEALLLPSKKEVPKIRVVRRRIDDYIGLVKAKKIGRPVPVKFDKAFMELLNGLIRYDPYRSNNMEPAMEVYTRYGDQLSQEARAKLYKPLKQMYRGESDPDRKLRILGFLCQYFNEQKADAELGNEMFGFAEELKSESDIEKKRVIPEHLPVLVKKCRKRFSETVAMVEYRSQRKERITFCFEHDLSCPGLVPTVTECAEKLFADRYDERMEAAGILIQMGPKAAPAEKKVLKMIRRVRRKSFSGATNLEQAGITILGNIRTTNPVALDYLIEALDSLRYKVPTMAKDALAQIGPPAIPHLLKVLENGSGGAQYKAVKALEKMGPDARPAVETLEAKLAKTKNLDIQDAIEDALETIKEE